MNIGHKYWTIADGWIPSLGDETVAFLNVSPQEAHVQIAFYYSNRDPVGPSRLTAPAKRVRRVPSNCLADASTITSDVPIVVQHPRLSSEISSKK